MWTRGRRKSSHDFPFRRVVGPRLLALTLSGGQLSGIDSPSRTCSLMLSIAFTSIRRRDAYLENVRAHISAPPGRVRVCVRVPPSLKMSDTSFASAMGTGPIRYGSFAPVNEK